MKQKRIKKPQFAFFAAIIIMFIFIISSIIMYKNYYYFIKDSVRTECSALKYALDSAGISILEQTADDTSDMSRFTLLDTDGSVLFDSCGDASTLENHYNRPEFIGAKEKGSYEVTRFSKTLSKQTFYHAVRLKNGMILRVSKSITNLFLYIITGFLVLVFFLFILLTLILYLAQKREMENVKKEFSANVSHELKTPLMSISGYAELIQSGIAREEDIPEFASRILHEAQRLTHLVNDIIQLSKLEESSLNQKFTSMDLCQLTQEICHDLELQALKKNITITKNLTPAVLSGDSQILYEIFYNLIDNAIRYTPENGKINLSLSSSKNEIVWTIQDNGIGIPLADQERIFERFYRVDKSHSRATGGTGLGLSIVKHGVLLHKGKINLESFPGNGCTIRLTFPAKTKKRNS